MSDVDTQADREDNFARSFQAEVGHVCHVQISFDPQLLLGELVVTSPGPASSLLHPVLREQIFGFHTFYIHRTSSSENNLKWFSLLSESSFTDLGRS
jgi:hypothetical protein